MKKRLWEEWLLEILSSADGAGFSPCHVEARAWDKETSITIDMTDHKFAIVKGDGTMYFQDLVFEGEEVMAVEDRFFVRAQLDEEDEIHEDSNSGEGLIEAKSTPFVHTGKHGSHGGVAWLQEQSESVNSLDVFRHGINEMLKDPIADIVIRAAGALMESGFTPNDHKGPTYECTSAFYQYAMNLAKHAELSDETLLQTGSGRRNNATSSGDPWNSGNPRNPYDHCGNPTFGRCGPGEDCGQGSAIEYAFWAAGSGCSDHCNCNRNCEYHDNICSCGSTSDFGCWTFAMGGHDCSACVGPSEAHLEARRRRRWWS